ncbi:MAG TPA: hypothetical protein VFK76_00925 [Gaiellaceae bacterium]|nr:hypothetical protein [Gaiellaceae bacterium]
MTGVRRLLLASILVCLLVPVGVSASSRATAAPISCGLPDTQPVWIDFADGSVSFWRDRFARPGVIVATGGPQLATDLRQAGAATVDWDMHLGKRVGTPSVPADPSTIEKRADSLFDYAVSVSGCQRPLIALNELNGASVPTPWTPTTEQYRSNVLRFVSRLAARGGRPALLVSSTPFTGGDATAWWQALAKVSDVVLENYSNANVIWKRGVVQGSRGLRIRYRSSAAELLAIGVPASRIGLMIGFQTGTGVGGREGLQPRSRWFEVTKLEAFAAATVAKELKLAHVWSWGWAMRDARSNDPDKTYAACVWLWARSPSLCDAAAILGKELDADRTAGQIHLPAGVRCLYKGTALRSSDVAALARTTGDAELALTGLVERALERDRTHISTTDILDVEKNIVDSRFGGSRSAYGAALARAHASVAVARGVIGDELRSREIERTLSVKSPAPSEIARFAVTYGAIDTRRIAVSPAPSWLPTGTGVALATSAPAAVFTATTGRGVRITTAEGRYTVRALDDTMPLDALPPDQARPAIVRELVAQEREDAYGAWSLQKQKGAESLLVCSRDRLPEIGLAALTSFLPFLSLDEAEAADWAASRTAGSG